MIKVNIKEAQKANLSGKGGKEFLLKNVFTIPNLVSKRISAPLYDFVQGDNKLELKKQADTQGVGTQPLERRIAEREAHITRRHRRRRKL